MAKGNKKGKARAFSSPEEIEKQLARGSGDESEESSEEASSSEDDDSKPSKPKGVSDLIEVHNPNRNPQPAAGTATGTVQLSRREREELARQEAKIRHAKLTAEGKTEQARADLARLALIRKQREEAAAKREVEQKRNDAKKAATTAKK